VWVLADLYERDFPHVAVGTDVTVTTNAYPGLQLRGRVNYIDPQVSRETRTAKLRVEVPNPRGELRLGMYAVVTVGSSEARQVVVVPGGAIQHVGDRTVVYVADPAVPGRFVERPVTVGRVTTDEAEIEAGLTPRDSVVTKGSFFVRAERDRLGVAGSSTRGSPDTSREPTPPVRDSAEPPVEPPSATGQRQPQQTASVTITREGFVPTQLTLRAGVPARVTFTRVTDETCATAVVFPSLKIRRDLPLKQPVAIDFTPAAGELQFACGMNMYKGTIVAR
jgi:hypothetical protein